MKITDELITEAIENTSRDQYGQTITMNKQVNRLFPDNIEEVEEYLKTSKRYTTATYGWKYGTYVAICER